jgi:hypothetical protein
MDRVFDDFNRADGGLGANWTTITGTGAPQIVGNLVQPVAVGGATGSQSLYTAITWPNTQYARCRVRYSWVGALYRHRCSRRCPTG